MRVLTIASLTFCTLLIVTAAGAQGSGFGIEQTLSDEAQSTTIAFDGLAFVTGDLCSDSFLPPGKIADFFGFQSLRDNDPDQMGHNTDFVTRIANNVLYVLNQDQVAQLISLAEDQVELINEYAYMRFPLMEAFRRTLSGDVPAWSDGLDEAAVKAYSARLYRLDGLISWQRAELFGEILLSIDDSQLEYLDTLAGSGMLSWPVLEDQVDPRSMSHDVHVAVMTYASQIFSWYAGNPDMDTYFCPERQGTYFGSFYLKDIPAMGNPDYTIDSNLTADMGRAFLAELTPSQASLVTDLVDLQRQTLLEIVDTRYQISVELRRLMSEQVDSATALELAEHYGELDGEIVFLYATHFAEVGQSLTSAQQAALMALRDLDDYPCSGAYLFSERISMPDIEGSDFLFGKMSVVPAVAHAAGVDSYFTSELHAFNASDRTMTVMATYTPREDLGGPSLTAELELAAGEMVSVDDPLAAWFGYEVDDVGVGSLLMKVIDAPSADLLVTSVVFALNQDGNEYGQLLPTTAAADAIGAGETAYLSTTADGQRMRVNLGAVAVEDGTRVRIRALDSSGLELAEERVLELEAGVAAQLNDLASELALDTIEDHLLEVEVDSGAAVVYGSVLDGTGQAAGTNDPTTIEPVTTGATTVTLLELGSVQGYDEFAGSVCLSNLASSAALVEAELYLRDQPGVAARASFTLAGRATTSWDDLVGELFGISSGVGTVVLTSSEAESLMATGREFSILRDQAGEIVGTAGQLIPGMTADDLLEAGRTYNLLGLGQGVVEGSAERSHVAAFNPGDVEVEVTLHLYGGSSGGFEGTSSFVVEPQELRHLNNIITTICPEPSGGPKRIEVAVDGPLYVAAFRVNSNGDPVTMVPMAAAGATSNGGLVLTSSAFQDLGTLPVDFSCDGAGVSPPLEWTGAPVGTEGFAMIMTTLAQDGMRWNWVLYDIPGDVTSLPEGGAGVGTPGLTSDGPLLRYYPPCAQGPGPKTYTFTIYALSEVPVFSVPEELRSGAVVSDAISAITLASSQLNVTYTRPE